MATLLSLCESLNNNNMRIKLFGLKDTMKRNLQYNLSNLMFLASCVGFS